MNRFGTDKPDLRYSLEMKDLSELAVRINSNVIQNSLKSGSILKGLVAQNWHNLGRKEFDRLTEMVKKQGAGGLIYISIPEKIQNNIQPLTTSCYSKTRHFHDTAPLNTACLVLNSKNARHKNSNQ